MASPHIVPWSRAGAVVIATLLLLIALRMPRPDVVRRCLAAVLLAAVAAEVFLHWRLERFLNPGLTDGTDALIARDSLHGATFAPDVDLVLFASGRRIHLRTDAEGRRTSGAPIDPSLPSLVFTGESTVAGIGLQWEETFPAILGARLRSQVVNLGSPGHRLDQSWLRLEAELPKLARPVAVVGVFMPGLVGRSFANQLHPPARPTAFGVELLPREPADLLRRFSLYRLW
ncbi:MAG TPA: hypothetical protein VG496_06320, partial [Myxococcales bacterium]|nr:hypothetical protein [Myxococcales bacterium]